MGTTSIEWTSGPNGEKGYTLNPWSGCAKAHTGCTNCYAEHLPPSMRRGAAWGEVWQGGQRVIASESYMRQPLAWARDAARAGERRKVFCASTADVLEVPPMPPFERLSTSTREHVNDVRKALDAARMRLWDIIRETARMPLPLPDDDLEREGGTLAVPPTPGLDWLLLTKRPENWHLVPEDVRPLVWLGTSISDQRTADAWVPRLLDAQGFRLRFLSVEPLVGPVDLSRFLWPVHGWWRGPHRSYEEAKAAGAECGRRRQALVSAHAQFVDWVIVGGESGRKARPCNVEWVRDIVRLCREAGVPCFVKQLGARAEDPPNGLAGAALSVPDVAAALVSKRLTDPKGGDPAEWPEDLRVQEFPAVGGAA